MHNDRLAKIERFEKGLGISIDKFIKIITKGFYYKKGKEIYWQSNAVFIGNGYCPHSNSMVATHYYVNDIEKSNNHEEDYHFWDWKERDAVFNFEDYGRTWAATEEELLKVEDNNEN